MVAMNQMIPQRAQMRAKMAVSSFNVKISEGYRYQLMGSLPC